MYGPILIVHSWLRYLVLGLGLWLLWASFRGSRSGAQWSPAHERLHVRFLAALDTQLLVGIALYVVSPSATAALADMGAAMKDAQLRFFGVEHSITMLIAVAVAHVGRVRSKRAPSALRYRRTFRWLLAWLVLTLLAIPWPGLDVGRPLFRW